MLHIVEDMDHNIFRFAFLLTCEWFCTFFKAFRFFLYTDIAAAKNVWEVLANPFAKHGTLP